LYLPHIIKAPNSVTSLQQSKEFEILTNLEVVNCGKMLGPASSVGDGRDRGRSRTTHIGERPPISN